MRLKRVDLPPDVTGRSTGAWSRSASASPTSCARTAPPRREKIRADADRQREVILAEAYRDAQRIKGEGDAQGVGDLRRGVPQNPEFYAFYRSLEAYRASFRSKSDVMVLEPNSDFFKYFKSPARRRRRAQRRRK